MPVVGDEPATYGYVEEDRHMVQAFLSGRMPAESWDDGLAVTQVLMACYLSAERGAAVRPDDPGLDNVVPAVARGAWHG